MPGFRRYFLFLAIAWFLPAGLTLPRSQGQEPQQEELQQEEQKQLEAVARFLTVLEKNPRRGTALDRVYGHHVEFGTLDTLVKELANRASDAASKGEHWMILGMIEYQRGNDAQAADAFTKAEVLRPKDALASYYLGQAQIRIGDSSAAVASLERALQRKPQRADELEIFQQLGRIHQRAQRTDEAMKVWKRLEELYPDDARVLEQIAVTLAEESQLAEALPRYEKLASTSKDDYRRTTFAIAAAELVVKQGNKSEGIRRLEGLLAELNPDSWLYRDVRRRIDDFFLRAGDQDGLVTYYQNWLESHPQDIEAMNRLARFLKQSARNPEAATWLNKALALAPSRTDIRKTYIDLLAEDKRFEDAAAQYEQLLLGSPSNADYLRDWGKMILRNKEMPEPERRKQALSIWTRMLEPNPKDAVMVAQVADSCRQNQMLEEAESLYRRAVDLAPGEPQYREYLGEFLHIQKRPDEAKEVWKEIAEGDRRNADNLARLAEIFNSFGYGEEACQNIARAIELSPKDFALALKGAEYHNKAARFDEAGKLVDQAEKLASNDEEQESVLNTRIDVLQSSQQLDTLADVMEEELIAKSDTNANEWYRLAKYREAQRQWDAASSAISKAIEKDPQSILVLTAAARIAESSGDFGRASDLFRKLTQVDRRSISDHWTSVTRLEAQMGRKKEALDAAKQLIIAAPSKTENYEFYAQTCFRLGEFDEGMQALRKAIRISPNEPGLMMALGTALADQMRVDEAIELYWRAYEKSEDLADKTAMVTKLANLYLQVNQLEKLIERLERERQDEENRRSATICIAQAWQTVGDAAEARKELEGLLVDNTKDTNLLSQLAKLCQSDSDMDAALNYQRQLVSIAPGDETEAPLASMLLTVGEIDEAKGIYAKLIEAEEDPVRQLRSLDSLLNSGNFDTALRVMEPLLDKQRDDWELLYRYGVCWANLKNASEAKTRFERIMSLTTPHETLGRSAAAKLKQSQEKARSDNLRGIATAMPVRESALQMTQQVNAVQSAVGLRADDYGGSPTQSLWTPQSYGLARMAAIGWLLRLEQESREEQKVAESDSNSKDAKGANESFTESIRKRGAAEGASQRDLLDWLYVSILQGEYRDVFSISKRLAKAGGIDEKRFFLQSLRTREASAAQARQASGNANPTQTPLDEADLEFMQTCFDEVTATQKDMNLEALYGSTLAYDSNGQAYVLVGSSYQLLPGVFRNSLGFQSLLMSEYRTAGKLDRVNELIKKQIDSAKSSSEWIAVLSVLRDEKRFDEMPEAFEKWKTAAAREIAEKPVVSMNPRLRSQQNQAMPLASALNFLQQWVGQLGSEEENDRILQLLDDILPIAVAEGRYRLKLAAVAKTTPVAATSTAQTNAAANYQTYYGKTTNQVALTFPPASTEVDSTTIALLRQFYDVFNKNGVTQEMVDRLKERSTQANDDSLFWNWYLASALWWSDDQDVAMEIVNKIMAESPTEPRTLFRWASLMESREEFEEALAIIERVSPRDQSQLVRRETAALRLAERIGDTDRARQAAERLFSLRLASDAQMQLLPQLRRLGLDAQADALLARIERTAAKQPSTLSNMMNLYQTQGKTEKANQAALTILRQTPSPYSASQSSNRQSPRYQSSNNRSSERNMALAQLANTGVLVKMTEALKEKLAKSPDSVYTLEQLIEFSKALNQNDKADEYLAQAIALRPNSSILRWNLANNLKERGKNSEACDQYLILFDTQPNWISEQFYEISQTFNQAKRQKEFFAKIQTIDFKRFRSPWELINLIENTLRQEPESLESFIPVIEKVFEANPSNRSYFISNLMNQPELTKNERVYQLIKRTVIPDSQTMTLADPWAGFGNMMSYNSQDGRVSLVFSNLLASLKSNASRFEDLKKTIQERVEQHPKWLAGSAMLALIHMDGTEAEEGRKRLEALLQDEALWNDMPMETCWYLGQELAMFSQSEDLAIRLLKKAELKQGSGQLQSSPITALVKFAKKRPELRLYLKERIDQRLQEQKNGPVYQYDPDYAAYQRIQQAMNMSDLFNSLDYPIDAYLAVKPLEKDLGLQAASRFYGNQESLKVNLKTKITTAQNSITGGSLIDSMELLFPEKRRIDLMMSYPTLKGAADERITSGLLDVLGHAVNNPESMRRIMDRLATLAEQQPNDLTVRLVRALLMIQQDCEPEALAPELASLLALAKLEPIAPGRRPNNRQRLEAKAVAELWLVAREVLLGESPSNDRSSISESGSSPTGSGESEPLKDQPPKARRYASDSECRRLADQLAELSIEGSLRQANLDEQSAVLLEMADIRSREKEWELAEKNWERLLALATRTTTKSTDNAQAENAKTENAKAGNAKGANAKAESATAPSKPSLAPPLTLSQFRLAMRIHSAAMSHGRSEIGTQAFAASLRGGMPVPDPETAPPVPTGRAMIMSRLNNAPAKDPIESEVQELLTTAFASWGSSSDTPAELYDALQLVVLPSNRPDQIRLYVNTSAVEDGREESIASSLVRAAAKAGKLDALKQEVEGRETKANSLLAKKSLLALIAMESGDLLQSKALMEELAKSAEKQSSEATIHVAALAAVRAFSNPELQSSASAIIDPLIKAQLAKGNTSNDDMFPGDARSRPILPDLALQLGRFYIAQGKESRTRDYFELGLQSRSQMYASYGGSDYVRVLQRTDLGILAQSAVRLGMDAYAWELLGRYADIPSAPAYASGEVIASTSLEYLIRLNRGRTPTERYQTWHEWTMPNAQRASVRTVYADVRAHYVPTMVVQSTERGRSIGNHGVSPGKVSNLSELVIAASECNQLEALKQQVESFDSNAASAATILLDLIHVCQKNDAEVSKRISDRMNQVYAEAKVSRQSQADFARITTLNNENALLADLCKQFGYDREATQLKRVSTSSNDLDVATLRDDTHWLYDDQKRSTPFSQNYISQFDYDTSIARNTYNAWWRYPLTGNFTISWDSPQGMPILEFGGARIHAQSGILLDSSGLATQVPSVRPLSSNPRAEIQVTDGQVIFRVDGQTIATEPTWGTSPWLAISTQGRSHQWRNLRIEGTPIIPTEVALIANDSIDGWSSQTFGEAQNRPRTNRERGLREVKERAAWRIQKSAPETIAWMVEQGQIRGKAVSKRGARPQESSLTYQRPLGPGETVRYEFFAKGNQMVAHPMFGDVAMMLLPEGLQLHYVTNNDSLRALYRLDPDTMIPAEPGQLKVDKLPWKDEDWNQVTLAYRENQVDLSLNGTHVYSLPIEPSMSNRFGLFRFRHQESLVRNAILSGPWPQSMNEDLVADVNARNPSYRSEIPIDQDFSFSGDTLVPSDWNSIAERRDQESVRDLLDMVLPKDAKYPRMSFQLSKGATDASLGLVPMQLDSVAVELARCARRSDLSAEVLNAIAEFQQKNPQAERSLNALRCLVAIESSDDKIARSRLEEMLQAMDSNGIELHNRIDQTAEFLVAKHASTIPALRDLALKMTEKIQKSALEIRDKTRDDMLMKLTNTLYGELKYTINPDAAPQTPSASGQWALVYPGSRSSAATDEVSAQPSMWVARPGKAAHFGANQRSLLFFQSPLQGDFEIVADRTTWDRQEMAMFYGLYSAEPKYDLSAVMVTRANNQSEQGPALEIPGFRDQARARFRIAVNGDKVTTYTNDVKINEQSVTASSFPWLVLRAAYPEFCGEIEDLRILGTPTIPHELDLTQLSCYEAWDGSVTGDSIVREGSQMYGNWTFGNDQVAAAYNRYNAIPESYIRYQRPMLEDGVVEYEFRFDENSEIHPAIGSVGFILRPEGIQIHRITALADDVPALPFKNAIPLDPPSKPVPLTKDEFNRVRLELKGDALSISVNGEWIATVPINDPPNKRHIGMFLLDDKPGVFRNMKYRGEWPKSLPALSEQFLAKP